MFSEDTVQAILKLKGIAKDEDRTLADRQEALTHILLLKGETASIEDIADSDLSEVAEMVSPWEDREFAAAWAHCVPDGMTLEKAKRVLSHRKILQNRLAIVVDESLPTTDRLKAINEVLADLPTSHYFHLNGYNATELLSKIKSVSRPPIKLDDVW